MSSDQCNHGHHIEGKPPFTQPRRQCHVTFSSLHQYIDSDALPSDCEDMYVSESGDDTYLPKGVSKEDFSESDNDNARSNHSDIDTSNSGNKSNAESEVTDVFRSNPLPDAHQASFKIKSSFQSLTSSSFNSSQHSNPSPTRGKNSGPQETIETAFPPIPDDDYDPLSYQSLLKMKRVWRMPPKLVSKSSQLNPTGPFTPETAPTHHLYTFRFPKDIPGLKIPPPTQRIIWQIGRSVSLLGAPVSSHHVGFGHLVPRSYGHHLRGIEQGISYWEEDKKYWVRLPFNRYYIPEVEDFDVNEGIRITTDCVMINSYLSHLREHFGITDHPTSHNYAHQRLSAAKVIESRPTISPDLSISDIFATLKPPIKDAKIESTSHTSPPTNTKRPHLPNFPFPPVHVVDSEDSGEEGPVHRSSAAAAADGVSTPSGSDFRPSSGDSLTVNDSEALGQCASKGKGKAAMKRARDSSSSSNNNTSASVPNALRKRRRGSKNKGKGRSGKRVKGLLSPNNEDVNPSAQGMLGNQGKVSSRKRAREPSSSSDDEGEGVSEKLQVSLSGGGKIAGGGDRRNQLANPPSSLGSQSNVDKEEDTPKAREGLNGLSQKKKQKRAKRMRGEDDEGAMEADSEQDTHNTGRHTLSMLQTTLGGLRGARANVQRVLGDKGRPNEELVEDSEGRPNEDKAEDPVALSVKDQTSLAALSAEDRTTLDKIGEELCEMVDRTGTPVHMLLRSSGLLVQLSQKQNSWNLFQEYVKTQDCKIAFDDFVPTVQPEYDDLKRHSTPQEWKKLKEFWQDTVTKDWMKKVSTAKTSPSRDNASMVKHMSQIVTQFSELQGKIRNGAPIEMITLVYSSDTHMRQLSQFLVSDPNLRPLFEAQEVSIRESIERFVTLTESFALGITSFEPGEMSIEDLLQFAADHKISSDSKADSKSPSVTPKAGPSEGVKADGVNHGGNKTSKSASTDTIRDYRGYAAWFIKDRELPGDLSLQSDRDGLRSVVRLLLKSLFADAADTASPNIWGSCIHLFLVKHQLHLVWPSNTSGKERAGNSQWDPKFWGKKVLSDVVKWISEKPQYVYIENWDDDEKSLPNNTNHPAYLDVPIIQSPSSKKSKVLARVWDCQEHILYTHVELERKSSNRHTEPLVRVTEIRNLKEDIKIYLNGHAPNVVLQYNNIQHLNQTLVQCNYPPVPDLTAEVM